MEQEVKSMRSRSAVLSPPQELGEKLEHLESLLMDISSLRKAHGESLYIGKILRSLFSYKRPTLLFLL